MSAKKKGWDIVTEPVEGGLSFDPTQPRQTIVYTVPGSVQRVKYRREGSRGRWNSFICVPPVPEDLQRLVEAYEKRRKRD